jgi:PHD/YefM family antitoxin component YafN of YafNO toxin-antitoxin module
MAHDPPPPADRLALELLAAHEEHEQTLTATKARASFFPLLERLATDPREVILVEHRGAAGRVMLVHEDYRAYVRELEALLRTLLSPATPGGAAFRLAGSMRLVREGDDVEGALRELRAADEAGTAAKFADL